jgi:mono/diheme cytochrome c family protein
MVSQGNLERFMPPFASLSNPERWNVVAYALSLSASKDSIAQGKQLFAQNCAECHGVDGKGDGPKAAGMANPPADFTDQEWMANKSTADFTTAIQNGKGADMPAFGDKLNEAQVWELSDYLRSLSFGPAADGAVAQVTPVPSGTKGAGTVGTETVGAGTAGAVPAPSTQAAAATTGKISGVVTNTTGGDIPAGAEVTLHGFDNMQSVITQTTTLAADGTYTFENVEMPANRSFLTTVGYKGTTYGSEIGVVQSGSEELSLPIQVYETTTDQSVLNVDRLHMFFEFPDENTIRVVQLYIISNLSDKTLVPAQAGGTTVNFELPQGAANLEFQDGALGERYIKTATGFGDTIPVHPGTSNYQMIFTYTLPYKRKLDLVQPLAVPADAVVVLVPEGGVKVNGSGIQDAGVRDLQGTTYHMYNYPALKAGESLRLSVSGRPSAGPVVSTGSTSNLLVGIGAMGIVLIVAGVWLFARNRVNKSAGEGEQDQGFVAETSTDNPDTIMDAILALDDLYKAGELPEEAYRLRRAELKDKLKVMMGNPKAG